MWYSFLISQIVLFLRLFFCEALLLLGFLKCFGNLTWKYCSLISNQHFCGLQVRATLEKVRKRMYGDYDEMRQKIRQLTQELSVSSITWRDTRAWNSLPVASAWRYLSLPCSLWVESQEHDCTGSSVQLVGSPVVAYA